MINSTAKKDVCCCLSQSANQKTQNRIICEDRVYESVWKGMSWRL